MGVAMATLRVEADFLQYANHRRLALGLGANAMSQQAFGNDLLHRHARAQAAERILEHHLNLPPQRAHQTLIEQAQLLVAEADLAFGFHQPQDRLAQRGFARTGFADNPQRFAALQAEADAVHRFDVRLRTTEQRLWQRKPDLQIIDFQQIVLIRTRHRSTAGFRFDQQATVRMLRGAKQRLAIGLFDDFTVAHYAHPLRDASHQIQIVTDQQQ